MLQKYQRKQRDKIFFWVWAMFGDRIDKDELEDILKVKRTVLNKIIKEGKKEYITKKELKQIKVGTKYNRQIIIMENKIKDIYEGEELKVWEDNLFVMLDIGLTTISVPKDDEIWDKLKKEIKEFAEKIQQEEEKIKVGVI